MVENDHYEHRWFARMLFMFVMVIAVILLVGAVLFFASTSSTHFSAFNFGWNWIWNVFWILLILWIIWMIVRSLFGWSWHGGMRHGQGSAKRLARRRYARGEISRKEYLQIIKDLDDTKTKD
jgi:uncharacterized membrane protein